MDLLQEQAGTVLRLTGHHVVGRRNAVGGRHAGDSQAIAGMAASHSQSSPQLK
jgi:hypothetical protein